MQLLGSTTIGGDCRIRSFSVSSNCALGDGVTVRHGCICDGFGSRAAAILGPYCHVRPGSHIGAEAHVGNFVETKKTTLGRGSKANHLTYLGDAEIGEGINIGAGTITCNYDGVNKHKTVSATASLSAATPPWSPRCTSARAHTSAREPASPRTCQPDALAVARGMQVNKPGWAKARREKQRKEKPAK